VEAWKVSKLEYTIHVKMGVNTAMQIIVMKVLQKTLEFLGLDENEAYLEQELEQGLIDNLQRFFFLNLERASRLLPDKKELTSRGITPILTCFFYNYILNCFVVVELKTHKLTYQDIGQLRHRE